MSRLLECQQQAARDENCKGSGLVPGRNGNGFAALIARHWARDSARRRVTREEAMAHASSHNNTGPHHSRTSNHNQNTIHGWFSWIALEISRLSGKPATFLTAVALIVVWAATGPLFGFSDTWQLIINTTTTIITFLMVFLIQNTQNRDTMALQAKLAELIIVIRGTKNELATAEDLSDEELEQLHHEYQWRATHALSSLEERRSGKGKDAA
jgi:low affinity Fe/Cu permease